MKKRLTCLAAFLLVFLLAPELRASADFSYQGRHYSRDHYHYRSPRALEREIRSNERRIQRLEHRRAILLRRLYHGDPRRSYSLRLEIRRLESEIHRLRLRNRQLYRMLRRR